MYKNLSNLVNKRDSLKIINLYYTKIDLQTFLFPGDFLAIGLDCRGAKQNYLDSTTNVARLQSFGLDAIAERRRPTILKKWDIFTNYVEENRQHIFYIFVFYVVTIALFIERFICK